MTAADELPCFFRWRSLWFSFCENLFSRDAFAETSFSEEQSLIRWGLGSSCVVDFNFSFAILQANKLFDVKMFLFSETMLQMWTDFARFGDPNGDPQQVISSLKEVLTRNQWPMQCTCYSCIVLSTFFAQGNGTSIWNPGQTMVFGVSGEITRWIQNRKEFGIKVFLPPQPRGVEGSYVPVGSALLANEKGDPCRYRCSGLLTRQ